MKAGALLHLHLLRDLDRPREALHSPGADDLRLRHVGLVGDHPLGPLGDLMDDGLLYDVHWDLEVGLESRGIGSTAGGHDRDPVVRGEQVGRCLDEGRGGRCTESGAQRLTVEGAERLLGERRGRREGREGGGAGGLDGREEGRGGGGERGGHLRGIGEILLWGEHGGLGKGAWLADLRLGLGELTGLACSLLGLGEAGLGR
jgi:hypothetical protein